MDWYEHGVAAAIKESFSKNKIFLVYLEGDNEESKNMEKTWENDEVQSCVKENCVAVKVHSDKEDGKQFASFYPVLLVPATYLINSSGVPIDIIPGFVESQKFATRLKETFKKVADEPTNSPGNLAEKDVTTTSTSTNATAPKEISANETEEDRLSGAAALSLEDKKQRAEELLEARREAKMQEEEEKEKEREFKRRQEGQELSKARRDQVERQAADLVNEIAKRKAEEKAAREAVREQIRKDRAEKAARFTAEGEARLKQKKDEKIQPQKTAPEPSNCRLQFRYPDGGSVVQTFEPDTLLKTVANRAVEESGGRYSEIRLASIYPKREFTEEELEKSVRDLGLMPSAALVVLPGHAQSSNKITSSTNSLFDFIFVILAPLFALLSWLKSVLFGSNENSSSTQNQKTQPNEEIRKSQSSRRERPAANTQAYKRHGNIHKFTQDDENDDDDDDKTWNGNSTQQM